MKPKDNSTNKDAPVPTSKPETTTKPTTTTIPQTTITTQKQEVNPKTSDLNSNLIILGIIGCLGIILIAKKKLIKSI